MLAGTRLRPIAPTALILACAVAAAPSGKADTFNVTDQAEFNAAVAAATQPGRNDTINVNAPTISSGPALMLPAAATAITINFNGVSGGSTNNPVFDVGFGTSGALTIANGTSLNFNTTNGIARMRVGYFDGANGGTGIVNMTGGQIVGTPTGSNYFVIDVGRGSADSVGTFNQSGGSITLNGGAFQVGVVGGQGTYTMSNNAVVDMGGGTVYIGEGTGGVGELYIHDDAQFTIGGTSGQFYIGENGGQGTIYQDGAGSLVNSTAPNGINLGSDVDGAPGNGGVGEYNLSAGELRIGGTTGNAGLNLGRDVNGTGTFNQTGGLVTLNGGQIRFGPGTSTYNLDGGTLAINVANPFGVTASGTREFNLGGGTIQGLTSFSSLATLDFNLIAGTTSTIDTAASTTATINGALIGDGALAKTGAGTLVLNGLNTYAGGTIINAGTLQLGAGANLNPAGAMQVNAGATFDVNGNAVQVGALSGAGTILAPAGSGSGGLAAGDSTNTAFSGTINGVFGKVGSGTLTIDNATFIGSAYVFEGAFAQTSGTTTADYFAIGEGASGVGALNVSGGTLAIGTALQVGDFGGTGTVNQTGGTVRLLATCGTPANCVALNVGNQGGTGEYNISGGTLELNGGISNIGRSADANPASDGALNISGNGLVWLRPSTVSGFGNGELIIGSRQSTTDPGGQGEGAINQTGGILRVENSSQLFLSGYGDGTYDLSGGTLQIGGNSLQAHYGGGAATGTYDFNLGGGTIQAYGTALTTSVNAELVSGTTSTVDTNNLGVTWSGILSGDGALSKIGAGTLTLNGNNTYTGGTQLNAGTLAAGNANALGIGTLSFNAASTLQFGGNFALGNAMNIAPGVIASIDTNGNTGSSIDGVIGGSGALAKIGAGQLTLNAANTYTGGTLINSGTLQLGADDRLAATGAVQVASGATFDLNDNSQTIGALSGAGTVDLGSGALTTNTASNTEFSGDIGGTGTFTKGGSGTLILSGDSSYTGPTTVDGGTLKVNGSLVSDVFVLSGTLGGNGAVGGLTVLGGGTAAPGNSIDTLTVNGDVTFQPGSTYQVEVDAAGGSDLISATGAATLNGGLVQVLAAGGAYSPLMTYTILTAAGGRTGEFDGVTSNLIFLQPMLDYDANNVYLRLARSSTTFAEFAQTPNELAVANALDQSPDSAGLLPFLLTQDVQGVRQAFNALSGEVHASAASALVMNSFYVREALFSRMIQAHYSGGGGAPSALGGTGPTTVAVLDPGSRMSLGVGLDDIGSAAESIPAYAHSLAFWTRGFGAWGDLNGNGNAGGLDRTLGGFISGVDARLGGGWRAGLATGYMRSDIGVGSRASSADIDSYVLAAYAGGAAGPFAIRSGGAWTWNNLDTTRNVVFPGFFENERASYDAGTGQLFAEVAYPMLYGASAVEPFAGLSYVHVDSDGFTESGPLAGLTSGGADQNVGVSLLGMRAGTTFPVHGLTVTPHGSLAWQYAFGDVTPEQALAFASTGIGFGIAGVPIARSSALIQGGIDLNLDEDLVVGVNYTGQLADDFNDNSVQGRFNWRF